MTIYKKITINNSIKNNFKPTRLCIKKLAGIYYFCKSTRKNIEQYTGSGVLWKARIKKYGAKNIKTIWISDWYYCPEEIQNIALHFSEENDIVNSEIWANMAPEWGIDCYTRLGIKEQQITKDKKSLARIGCKNPMYGKKGELSPHFGKKHNEITKIKQSIGIKKYSVNRPDTHNKNISNSLKGNKNLIFRVTGHRNPCFLGWYVAPDGILYDSSRKAACAAGGADKKTLIKWAKNNKNGWYFVPKENFCLLENNLSTGYAVSQ